MAYGAALPTDNASKKFLGVVVNNAGANEFQAIAGANRRTQNAEIIADMVSEITTSGGAGATGYGVAAEAAIREMHRQVGDLVIERGLAVRGLLVRHLVMPRESADTAAIMRFIASLSRDTYVNVMRQYRPLFRARTDARIGARVTDAEHRSAIAAARAASLRRVDGEATA